jgi:hypothetical protein
VSKSAVKRECPIPDHADLEFAQQARTGRVHVLPYRPERWEEDAPPVMLAGFLPEMPTDPAGAEAVVDAILGRVKVLCGYQGYTAPGGSLQYVGREHFEDDAFCVSCIRALGDKSWRAFESPFAEEDGQR